jgi:hypothetical protein
MSNGEKKAIPTCSYGKYPHPYVEHGESDCEFDQLCYQWETNREETKMSERSKFRSMIHARPQAAEALSILFM